jgi:hypothetical protein
MDQFLIDLGIEHGTDKVDHGYLRHYADVLGPFRHESFDLLEIGVKTGASIRMWHDFFPAARIVGLDRKTNPIGEELPRFTHVQGDQADLVLLQSLIERYAFRVIVDDGSHLWGHQIFTFQTLFPWIEPGGVYICEDIQTSFGTWAQQYQAGASESAAAYFFRVAQALIAGEPEAIAQADPLMAFLARRISALTFIPHGAIITARQAGDTGPLVARLPSRLRAANRITDGPRVRADRDRRRDRRRRSEIGDPDVTAHGGE